jgi:hypothetical protein
MSGPQTPTPTSPPSLDQYKAYLSDLGNFGTRYTTANGFYLSVITALLGILALTKAGDVFEGSKAYLGLAVSTFAVLVCMVWSRSIASYRKLFAIKFEILREMERAGNWFPIYEREDKKRGKTSLLENERLIPLVLSLPFLITLFFLGCKLVRSA